MSEPLRFTVLSPKGKLLQTGEVKQIQLRLVDGGGIGILPGHAPLVAETVSGTVWYVDTEGRHDLKLEAGILRVSRDGVLLLTAGTAGDVPDGDVSGAMVGSRYTRLKQDLEQMVRGTVSGPVSRETHRSGNG